MTKRGASGDRSGRTVRPPQSTPRTLPRAKSAPLKLTSEDLFYSLGYRIRRAQLWVLKDLSRRLAPFDIGPSQFSVLSLIEANPDASQFAIARSMSIERAGLGRLVDQLERRRLIHRSASAINPRYYVLNLTEAGSTLLTRLRPVIAKSDEALASRIGPRAFRELHRALSAFLKEG